MFLRKLAIFLMFVIAEIMAMKISNEQVTVISTTQCPSDFQPLNESPPKAELVEIRATLKELNANINQLTETKEKTIEQIDNRLKDYDAKLSEIKKELIETKNDIIAKIENLTLQKPKCESLQQHKNVPTDCVAVKRMGHNTSGIYRIKPVIASEDFLVWCDMTTRGGGWTSVLNRFDGSQNFYLNWTDYKSGFGNLWGEFWLGLQHLYQLTNSTPNELLFEMVDWDLQVAYANYNSFSIGNESDDYSLEVLEEYTGDAGDCFHSHKGQKFSTADRDHDNVTTLNCATFYNAAWWYEQCFCTNPTGKYRNKEPLSPSEKDYGIYWTNFRIYSLKEIKMMIRPTNT